MSRSKIVSGIYYGTVFQDQRFLQKNISFDVNGLIATPMVTLRFHSLREAIAAMEGAESTMDAVRDKFDERRLSLCLSYVDSGLVIRHVIYAPEAEDYQKLQAEETHLKSVQELIRSLE